MENSHAHILCPTCPVCGSEPLFVTPNLLPWFCPRDECLVFGWDPYATLEENLLDASPLTIVEDVPDV